MVEVKVIFMIHTKSRTVTRSSADVEFNTLGRGPIDVDLDPGQGQISVPGTIGAVVVEKPAEVDESFSQAAPLVYHYGHTTMSINSTLYNTLISRMAEVIHQRMDENPRNGYTTNEVVERSNKLRLEGRELEVPPIPNTLMPSDMQKTDLDTKLEPVTPEIDDRIKADNMKSGDLDCDEVTKKKQKKRQCD
ncbi:uncharacterized protein LOC132937858 [Metopolophium dirhodum]|uniref:uncharacterized protein LOC132937858 n=1 Tax=Metopolophium dirhodum TaxID=44670 RepID=UPI0029902256|nr:uncharacterized protein LOC132937858 [Metopolophium dirhodum]